jgi:hypothetical protein
MTAELHASGVEALLGGGGANPGSGLHGSGVEVLAGPADDAARALYASGTEVLHGGTGSAQLFAGGIEVLRTYVYVPPVGGGGGSSMGWGIPI